MNLAINPLDPRSIESAIARIEDLSKRIQKLETELPKALAEFGVMEAQVRFDSAAYDILINGAGTIANITVEAVPIDGGYSVVANGKEVCFVEFGAGVFYNGSEPYLATRPPQIKKIGEYGKGRGKRRVWGYYSDFTGNLMLTRGTPASNSMYYTAKEMQRRLTAEARRILHGD